MLLLSLERMDYVRGNIDGLNGEMKRDKKARCRVNEKESKRVKKRMEKFDRVLLTFLYSAREILSFCCTL